MTQKTISSSLFCLLISLILQTHVPLSAGGYTSKSAMHITTTACYTEQEIEQITLSYLKRQIKNKACKRRRAYFLGSVATVVVAAAGWYVYTHCSSKPQSLKPADKPKPINLNQPKHSQIVTQQDQPVISEPADMQKDIPLLAPAPVQLAFVDNAADSQSEEEIDIGQDDVELEIQEPESEPTVAEQAQAQAQIIHQEEQARARRALEQAYQTQLAQLQARLAEEQRVIREQSEIYAQKEREYTKKQTAQEQKIAELYAQSAHAEEQLRRAHDAHAQATYTLLQK